MQAHTRYGIPILQGHLSRFVRPSICTMCTMSSCMSSCCLYYAVSGSFQYALYSAKQLPCVHYIAFHMAYIAFILFRNHIYYNYIVSRHIQAIGLTFLTLYPITLKYHNFFNMISDRDRNKNHKKAKNQLYKVSIPYIALFSKKPTTMTAKNRNKNQKVINWGPRQGRAQWQNDQGSQKGSVPGKPKSLRTNTSKKLLDNIRGIGEMFNRFLSTFKHGITKPLYKVL